jgi:hypothetical protein
MPADAPVISAVLEFDIVGSGIWLIDDDRHD